MKDSGFKIYTMNTEELAEETYYRECYNGLSDRRRNMVDRYRNLEDRKRSVGAGILLDRGLREYGLREADMRVERGENGKPYFPCYPEIHFNLSHSGDMVMAVFAGMEIGCDIEGIRTANLKLAERFFCPGEYNYLAALAGREQEQAFCRLWTLKESFLKATGMGLKLPLDAFEFRIPQEGEAVMVRQDYDKGQYVFCEYDYGRYHAAVCMERKGNTL